MRNWLAAALLATVGMTGAALSVEAAEDLSCDALAAAIRQTTELLAQHRMQLLSYSPAAAQRADSAERLLELHHRLILLHVQQDCGTLPITRRF